MNFKEIWTPIEGFEEYYAVSNWGRVRSFDRFRSDGRFVEGRVMALSKYNRRPGQLTIGLRVDGKRFKICLSRTVAKHFLNVPKDGRYRVAFKNPNLKYSCNVKNLEIIPFK